MADISKQEYGPTIAGYAKKYGVPYEIMWGVYGVETNFGQNSNTSSAGAMGPWQFIPSTARAFGYPLTNNPTPAQFSKQTEAAAKYLSQLYKETGSWDGALRRYSGGGYGLAEVKAKAGTKNASSIGNTQGAGILGTGIGPDVAEGASESVGDVLAWTAQLGTLLSKLQDPQFWIRVLEVVGGVVLMVLGLKTITGVPTPKVIPV